MEPTDASSFRLRAAFLPPAAAPPTPIEKLRAAYRAACAADAGLAALTLAAIERRLQMLPELRSYRSRSARKRALLLRALLEAPAYTPAALRAYADLPSYDSLWQLRRPLLAAGLLTARHHQTVLTPAGETWLLELVQPAPAA